MLLKTKHHSCRRNREYYFDPNESLNWNSIGSGFETVTFASSVGTDQSVHSCTTEVFLQNHGLATGDEVIYKTHGGDSIGLPLLVTRPQCSLGENSRLYVANLSRDFIGVSSVPVGLEALSYIVLKHLLMLIMVFQYISLVLEQEQDIVS